MVTKFETFLTKQNLSKNTVSAYLWTVNYYLKHYGGNQEEKPFGLQGVSGRQLQTADRKSPVVGLEQVSGIYQNG